ncbi:type I-E CRISPR-associated protein Cse1/CasA [Streptomyces yaizuensis]|uniref:Type I-E CRISPR-associated protein Cse1/CasA n=1 Tax=Streptomyces yaizuensis TaxID=2989713 RepID=A0ABQ5P6Q4_9ACTN|nr:type I-E CRISPR-associated protein Cse1/CasA [Streptomyces sp. YSPA8]GLF98168.1 type I-E CRISPR-associated protein Cse1/CasA [Streptomyces sp. YSPA8]
MGFDLLERPWLPVLDSCDGPARLSLREAFARAHEVRLAGRPEETAALMRPLLAVWASAARPAGTDGWDAAWHAPTLDTGRVTAYLDAHAGRFDLLSPVQPFWQSPAVTEPTRDAAALDCASWGSGASQFAPHLLLAPRPWDPADAAVGLVVLQAWHPGGIRTGHPDDPATRGGKVYGSKPGPLSVMTHLRIPGSCLKDELLLNCPPGARLAGDAPVWERDPAPAPMRQREPAGPLDWWTWPTRRLRLLPGDGGRITAVAVHDGDRPGSPDEAAAQWDPAAAVNARGTRLAITDAARHLLPWAPAALLDDGAGGCAVLDHATAAAERGTLPADLPLRAEVLRAGHTTSHRAALSGIVHLTAPLGPARTLADPEARAALAAAARRPWELQREINHAAAEALNLAPKAVQSRASLSLAAHLAWAWEEFAADPAAGSDAWHQALRAAVRRTAGPGSSGRAALAAARIHTAALVALTTPAPVPQEDVSA